jgi:hypothetical protein
VNDLALREARFPEQAWLIDDLVPLASFILLVAGPKVGKTALMLPIALRVAREGRRVLYVALDDSARRIRQRSMMAHPMSTTEHQNLMYKFMWKPTSPLIAFAELGAELESARANGVPFDLVVIDTYGQMIGRRPTNVDMYRFDCEIGDLFKNLVEDHGCTVIASHHTNRSGGRVDDDDWLNSISGTNGMAGAADMIWGLYRSRGSRDGIWRATGNDFEEMELPITLGADMVWKPAEGLTATQAKHSGVPRLVLDYLSTVSEATFRELLDKTGANGNTLNSALTKLAQQNTVQSNGKHWSLTICEGNRVLGDVAREMFHGKPSAGLPVKQEVGASRSDDSAPTLTPLVPVGHLGAVDPIVPGPRADSVSRETGIAMEPVPEGGDNPAIGKMIQVAGKSTLKALYKMGRTPEEEAQIKEALAFQRVCLGGRGGQWALRPDLKDPPLGVLKAFDRKAAFWQGHPWLVPNQLRRVGRLTWAEIHEHRYAGLFSIIVPEWRHPTWPDPLGRTVRKGDEVLVTRDILARLHQLAGEEHLIFPNILHGWVGKGSEDLLSDWTSWCLEQRRTAPNRDEQSRRKIQQNTAMGSLRIVSPGKTPGLIDRWDWQYGFNSLHYAQLNRHAMKSINAGEPLRAVGNTDELVYEVPEGEDPRTWVPPTLRESVDKHRYAPKYIMPGPTWNIGRWREHEKYSLWYWENEEWVNGKQTP